MNTDTLHETFKDLEADARALDPDRVLAGARRRRRRRNALTGAASLGVAAVTVASFALAGAIGPGEDAPVAGQIAAAPPVIADRTWYRLFEGRWIHTSGTSWRIGDPPGTKEWTGVANTLTRKDLARGWVGPGSGGRGDSMQTEAFVKGDVRRVVLQVEGDSGVFRHEAKVYRLAGVPGWVLAYAEYPAPGPVDSHGAVGKLYVGLDAYDAAGRRVLHCDPPPYAPDKKTPPKIACTTG